MDEDSRRARHIRFNVIDSVWKSYKAGVISIEQFMEAVRIILRHPEIGSSKETGTRDG